MGRRTVTTSGRKHSRPTVAANTATWDTARTGEQGLDAGLPDH